MEGMATIYAEDATLPSPLVSPFFGPEKGIARSKKEEVFLFLREKVKPWPDEEVY